MENLKNELSTENIIYEKTSSKDDPEKIQKLFQKIAIKYNEFNRVLTDSYENDLNFRKRNEDIYDESESKNTSSKNENIESNIFKENINENIENYSEYQYKENTSDIDINKLNEKDNEKSFFSEFGTILLKECYSDSYCDSNGSLNVSFEKLGYKRKKKYIIILWICFLKL